MSPILTSPTNSDPVSYALSGATWHTDDRSNIVAASDGSIVQVGFDATLGAYVVQTLAGVTGKYLSYSGLRAVGTAQGEQIKSGTNIGTSTLELHVTISDSPNGYRGEGNLEDPIDYFNTAPAEEVVPAAVAEVPDAAAVTPQEVAPTEPVSVPAAPAFPVDAAPLPVKLVDPAEAKTFSNLGAVVAKASLDKIVADALATPNSAAAPIAHQQKGDSVKGGLASLISLPFWNDTLTRAFNTFLQVGLASVGAGATHIFTLSDLTALKIAGGAAAISLVQSLIRATTPSSAK